MNISNDRLLLNNTEFLKFCGLDKRTIGNEFDCLSGPSYKTTERILDGQVKFIRPNTLASLKNSSNQFYGDRIPRILGAKTNKLSELIKREETEADNAFLDLYGSMLHNSKEKMLCEEIENRCYGLIDDNLHNSYEVKCFLYNLFVIVGAEYMFFSPHTPNFINDLIPKECAGKIVLPIRRWSELTVSVFKEGKDTNRIKNFVGLATELGLSKQELNRYMNANNTSHLPSFKTMELWAENLNDSFNNLAKLPMLTLIIARCLHHYYLDTVSNSKLSQQEVIKLFSMSGELRDIWLSILHKE